jgi:DNA-binding response OmpR family regulator
VLARETVLVLEDEPLILIEIADALADAGAEVISAVRTDQALRSVELRAITAAVLDIGLSQESFHCLCRRLEELGVPFLFYSGYGQAPDAWSHVPLIVKPASEKDIVRAVAQLRAAHKQLRGPSLGSDKRQHRLT